MTKKLLLVRHSKAGTRKTTSGDFERPLTSDGVTESYEMANLLRKSGIKPDIILSSSAARAAHTAEIFSSILNVPKESLNLTRMLYYGSAKTILDHLYGLPSDVNCVMVVTHNPGISELARGLSSGEIIFMENTQLVVLDYDIDEWYQFDEMKPASLKSLRPGMESF